MKPEDFGFERCEKKDLAGGGPEENAEIVRSILSAQDRSCRRQAVQLNAGAALYIAGKAGSYREGVAWQVRLSTAERRRESCSSLYG